jgi:phenylacetate-CoA ligase
MNSLFEKSLRRFSKPPVLKKYFSGSEDADQMAPDILALYQKEAAKSLITNAFKHSPFYQRKMKEAFVTPRDIKEIEDLSRLPLTTKDELRGNPWELLACDKKDVALIQVSTGTTGGKEVYIMNTWRDYYLGDLAPGYGHLVPVESGDICFDALPFEMSSAGLSFYKIFMDGCQATVIPAGKGGVYSTPAKSVKLLQDLLPTYLISTPSWSMTLAEAAMEIDFNPSELPLKKMWLTGEGCSAAFRERVQQIWGTTANFYYGSLECGCIGIECDLHNGYHVTTPHIVLEIVDPKTGVVLEPGEIGEIVVTCLLRYDTPLLRFRTQDLGYIDLDPCPCGVTLPRLHLRGRQVDQITVQGIPFSPYYLEEFLMRLPEVGNWFQFVVDPDGSDQLKIRCELAAGVKSSLDLADTLASKMEFNLGIPCIFEFMDQMPRSQGKTVRVVHS